MQRRAPGQSHILVVEDDSAIAGLVITALQRAGFRTSFAGGATAAMTVFHDVNPDVVVLDVMLPGDNGFQVLERIRQRHDTPVIMLTALSETDDKIEGLKSGADDYLAKPFSTQELLARIEALLRRSGQANGRVQGAYFSFSGWTLDTRSREFRNQDDVQIILTSAEFDLLKVLCEHAGQVLSRDKLVRLAQGRHVEPYDRSVDTLVSRIRQKIEQDPGAPQIIKTVRNGGYLFVPSVEEILP